MKFPFQIYAPITKISLGDKQRNFMKEFKSFVLLEDRLIVCYSADETLNRRNICCLNFELETIWEVQPISDHPDFTGVFISVYIEDGKLFGFTQTCLKAEIDRDTGYIISTEFTK